MTTFSVSSSSQLTTALNSAKGGDVIKLAAGNYGDVTISKSFSSDVTLTSASTTSPATFHSLTINSSDHLNLDSLNVAFTPNASTLLFTPGVAINDSSYITFAHSAVIGGGAVTGVAQTATSLDGTGNVLGLPTGYGVAVNHSDNVKLDGLEIAKVSKGVVLNNSDYVTLSHSDIHDLRTTAVVAGGGSHITIDSNHLHDSTPWNWGSGDHADFIAMWTDPTQKTASTDIKITNNLVEQGNGVPVLGMWLQGGDAGFTNVTISKNAFLLGNNQGIVLWDVHGGSVDNNTLLQSAGSDWKAAPAIVLNGGAQNISTHDNSAYSFWDVSGSTGSLANSMTNNHTVQMWDAKDTGYYTSALLKSTEAAYDITGLFGVGGKSVVTTPTTPTTPTIPTTPTTPTTPTVPVTPTSPVVTAPPASSAGGVVVNGTWDYTKLAGGSGADTISSKSGGDTLSGGSGDDTYYISGGKSLVAEAANSGVDTVVAKGDYTLTGNVENLVISNTATNGWSGYGNALNNVITGNAGNNYLDGSAGADTLNGGLGNDILIGGAGNDRLIGGAGKDTFRFDRGSGQDVIADFSKADHDSIDISAYTKAGYKAAVIDVGADVKISFTTGDSIILTGVHAKDLIANSFGFSI